MRIDVRMLVKVGGWEWGWVGFARLTRLVEGWLSLRFQVLYVWGVVESF